MERPSHWAECGGLLFRETGETGDGKTIRLQAAGILSGKAPYTVQERKNLQYTYNRQYFQNAAGHSPLYVRRRRDVVIWFGFMKGQDIKTVDKNLYVRGMKTLTKKIENATGSSSPRPVIPLESRHKKQPTQIRKETEHEKRFYKERSAYGRYY